MKKEKKIKRIQYEVTEKQIEILEELKEVCSTKTTKALLDNALALLSWVIREAEDNRAVGSFDRKSETFKEIVMPTLRNNHPIKKLD